jgi:hypothetical protein
MGRSKADGRSRASNINDRDGAFHLVMSGAVKQITQGNGAQALTGEVGGESGGRATKQPHERIELLPAPLQVGTSDGKVRTTQGNRTSKQSAVRLVKECVLVSLDTRSVDDGDGSLS